MSKIHSGGLAPRDGNMQCLFKPSRIATADGAGTALTSPRTSVSSSIITLTSPSSAVYVNLYCADQDIRLGVDVAHSGGYTFLKRAIKHKIPVSDMTAVYVRLNAGTSTVYFDYETLS